MPDTVNSLLKELTLDEKVSLLSGQSVWHTAEVARLGIPALKVTDGPNGARGDGRSGATAVNLPASIGLGASFDVALVTEVGQLLGRETLRKGAHVLLAPTINMARHPLGGRNFESFGEDPTLTSAMAVAYIQGVQDEGVGACAKHFVANDVEYRRMTVSSELDDRTLREVYLAPFEAAVSEAGVWSIMAAYPKLNGVFCTEHRWLLQELLRDEWGFDGVVMSDWGATHHRSRPVAAGLDLEMPGPPRALGDQLLAAVAAGEIDEATIDQRVGRMLDLVLRSGRLHELEEEPERSIDLASERDLARRAAADGMVLLRNNGVLPLHAQHLTTVAVIGPNADPGVFQGGGSAMVPAHHLASPLSGLAEQLPGVSIVHEPGVLAHRYLPLVPTDLWAALQMETFIGTFGDEPGADPVEPTRRAEPGSIGSFLMEPVAGLEGERWSRRWTGSLPIDNSGLHQFSVLAVGQSRVLVNGAVVCDNWTDATPGDAFFQMATTEVVGEVHLDAGSVASVVVEWAPDFDAMLQGLRFGHLPPVDAEALLDAAVGAAASADVAVVVVGLNADWETESHDRPMFGLPGPQNELIARVLEANPKTIVVVNAGGPVHLPLLEETPATLLTWYPGQEFGSALADVLLGNCDAGGRMPITLPRQLQDGPTNGLVPGEGDRLVYAEGLLVGHRWFDRYEIEPAVCFGHGLSYAEFEVGAATIGQWSANGELLVAVPVTNVADRAGKCVIQVYLEPPAGTTSDRPVRTLAGFSAVSLEPGTTEVLVTIGAKAFRAWQDDGWVVLEGAFGLRIGQSSRDLSSPVAVPHPPEFG